MTKKYSCPTITERSVIKMSKLSFDNQSLLDNRTLVYRGNKPFGYQGSSVIKGTVYLVIKGTNRSVIEGPNVRLLREKTFGYQGKILSINERSKCSVFKFPSITGVRLSRDYCTFSYFSAR